MSSCLYRHCRCASHTYITNRICPSLGLTHLDVISSTDRNMSNCECMHYFFFFNVLGFDQTVAKDSDLYQRLIINSEPILFVGESPNLSHTLAFATMRGSLEGILSTSLNASHFCTREWLLRMIAEQQLQASSREEGGLSTMHGCTFQIYALSAPHSMAAKFNAFREYADNLEGNPDHILHQIFCNADATKLEQFVESRASAKLQKTFCPFGPFGGFSGCRQV